MFALHHLAREHISAFFYASFVDRIDGRIKPAAGFAF
jgi:hypothetical protein